MSIDAENIFGNMKTKQKIDEKRCAYSIHKVYTSHFSSFHFTNFNEPSIFSKFEVTNSFFFLYVDRISDIFHASCANGNKDVDWYLLWRFASTSHPHLVLFVAYFPFSFSFPGICVNSVFHISLITIFWIILPFTKLIRFIHIFDAIFWWFTFRRMCVSFKYGEKKTCIHFRLL